MQLRQYAAVIRRRWPVVVAVVLLALIGGGALLARAGLEYTAEVRLLLNRVPTQPVQASPDFRYDDYYRFLATEYMLDDLVEEVRGNRFALAVLERLHTNGVVGATEEMVQRGLKPERAHRILTVEVTAPTREMARVMARSVEELLTANFDQFRPPDGSRASVRVIHADPDARSNLVRSLLVLLLQVALATLLGIGLAFLLEYLDDRIRDSDDARALGTPLLASLPGGNGRAR
jgi:capsular polysaccharide biosynthesis protein